jgi:hypothetical protein
MPSFRAACVVTSCLLFMHTASGSDRILEQNWHDLNSFRPQNLHASYYGICCSACKTETCDNAGPESSQHKILAPILWTVACAESSHTAVNHGRTVTWRAFEVEVTLRPTVSRPVRLGALPPLEQVTRSYFYFCDNYFLYFSCRAPSLTRERVCNLQYNDAS